MANKTKKIISLILSLLMIFSTVSVAFAAESEVTVNIISFMRGEQANLRSSELLEARVEGYDGNVRELTYKWYNSLGTYLYVYNSHNMYNINNTDGEIEIYNKDKGMSTLGNMEGRNYANSFAGVGYAWASVYGAGISGTSLAGTVTVEVYDKEGKLLCSDKHEGKYSNKKNTGFVTHNLANDMDNVVIGLFEGDKRNVKDLLGESAILHITCTASTVADGKVRSGGEHIKLDKSGDYYITGIKAGTSTDSNGDAEVDLKVTKSNCKFHQNTSGTATTTVFVFKRPTTETTTTTLTLTGNLDSRCDYFIGGVEGTKQSDGTIIFTGLTPNTPYSVEVRGEYKDNNNATKYAYAYVYDTTKPIYKATVKTYLDGVITDISDIHGEDVSLYLHEDKENADYIELTKDGVGTYSAEVVNGVYFPWHIEAGDHYHQAREYKLIVENANAELNLHHYSVKYYYDETAFSNGEELAKDIFSSGASVKVAADVPVREGYIFAGWKYDSNIYTSGEEVTSSIYAPISLVAQWEKAVNVTVNVTIDHTGTEGGYDHNANKDELLVEFLEMPAGAPAFAETGDKLNFSKEGVTDENGYSKDYTCTEEITNGTVLKTIYKADSYTYTGLLDSSEFGATVSKSGYDVLEVKKTKLENGDWEIDISLRYNPDDFDLGFSVKMADDVPKELYPDAVIVKIACWDETANEWIIISQQRTTDKVRPGVRVDIDKTTGEGSGAYPVWKHQSDGSVYGYRAVVTGFIYKDSTIIVPTEKDHSKDGEVIITYTDGNYTAIMGNVDDGQRFSTSLNGAYYNDALDAQQGTLDAVITIEKYDVTFDAQGGKVNGKEKDIAEKQYYVPSFDAYKPTMSEHNFLGWYLDAACTEPATEGVLLTEDITVYAKWDKILTGTLIVDGYYDSEHPVDDADRAKYALIELEEITDDGTYNIAGQTVTINWNTEDHFSEKVNYKFTGLDPNKTYRIDVYLTNYTAFYQNSTTVINGNDDLHDDYNDKDYTAIYPETSKLETFVNTFLHFEPEEYMLNVEVDSTALGEAFRPEDALVKYYSEEVGVNDEYILIVQHKDENSGVHVGIDKTTGLNDAIYGDYIWKKNYTGNLYNYQADLAKLDGKALSEWPVIVYYGDSVRWSPLNQAPTDSLKVTIIPMWYKVIYDLNGATDIDGNEKIEVARGHYWSHESELDKSLVPIRPGYDFGGWYSDPECTTGKEVTVISADVAADTTVYAKWIAKSDCVLTIEHIDSNTLEFLDVEVRGSQTHDTVINATDMVKDFKGYTYVSASADSITIDANNTANLLKLYYTANEYEYTVNYLEEGTDKIVAPSKNETAVYGTQAVETAVVVKGYSVSGDSTKTITIDTENNVINFYYTLDSYDYTVKYLEEGTNKPLAEDKTASAGYGDSITETAAEINGYILTDDSSKTITIDTANNVIIFYYKAGSYDYTVKYLEEGTGKTLADDKTETATYGAEVTESAVAIEGYSISGDSTKSIKIDTENNAIIFYYTAYSCDYTVNYLEKDTNKVLSAAKKSSAKYGEIITETARAILGYTLADVSSKTITVDIAIMSSTSTTQLMTTLIL